MPRGKQIKENEGVLYGFSEEEWRGFHKSKRSRIRNPEMQKESMRKWASKQPAEFHRQRGRKSQLKLKYGLTEADYQQMLETQNGACAICGTTTPTGKWKVFAVDHCHESGKVRGLLCNECNRGIGLLRDSSDLLRKAAEYIDACEQIV